MTYKRKTRLPWDWKSRLVLLKRSEPCDGPSGFTTVEFALCFRKGTTPKGFDQTIGGFTVEDKRIHSHVDSYFQNRGLGLLCYRTILHEFGELRTCYHAASPQAKNIWRKLVKLYPYTKEFWSSLLIVKAKGQFSNLPVISIPYGDESDIFETIY